MLGMMNKGGQQVPQGMGQNPNLAALFGGNAPAAPGGGGAPMLPQIMPPQTPTIGMPPAARLTRPQQTQMPAAPSFKSMNELMRFQHTNPGQLSPDTANMWKKSLKNPWGR